MEPMVCNSVFTELLERLYFHQQWLVDTVVHELLQYHHIGVYREKRSSRFLDLLTERLQSNREAKDLPNALAVILADILARKAIGEDGRLSTKEAEKIWGSEIAGLLSRMTRNEMAYSPRSRPENPVTRNELLRHVSIYAPQRMGELLRVETVPFSLPLIDHLAEVVGHIDASIGALVCVQHLFGSTLPLIKAIVGNVIPKSGVFILGKPYSTNYATMWTLREQHGWFVHPGSVKYTGLTDFHLEEDQHIEALLMKCVRWMTSSGNLNKKRVLLIDDGGRCIRKLHGRDFADVVQHFTCVEQTRRGIWEIDDLDLKVPVVNVAESWVKLKHESPLIANSVCQCVLKQLDFLRSAGIEVFGSALVVGYGAIGSAVAKALNELDWKVVVFDKSSEGRDAAKGAGFSVEAELQAALSGASLIVGCTGRCAVKPNHYRWIRDGTVLVGASSADLEFSCRYLRSYAESFSAQYRHVDNFNLVHERYGDRLLYLGDFDHPCHFLYVIRYQGKRFFLLNGGFPVNMTGEVDPIPATRIQLTRSLLYAGAIQASRENAPGIHELCDKFQDNLIHEYLNLSGDAQV